MSYQTIVEELPLLTRKQLDEIRKRAALLLQNQSIRSDNVEEQDWLLEGILRECQQRGTYVGRSFHIKRSGSFSSFATKSEALRELLTECAPGLSPVQYIALGQVCARELATYLPRAAARAEAWRVRSSYTDNRQADPQVVEDLAERAYERTLRNYQVSFQMLLSAVDRIPMALEASYPNYMASRLLQLVVPYDGE
jgi:hypothetical protein